MAVPRGYTRVDEAGATIVARDDVREAVLDAYRSAPADARTLHGFASRVPGAGRMQGRDVAYAIALPGTTRRVVVRHNRHGGALRALTGDLFVGPGAVKRELDTSLALARLGVATPAVVAYGVYPAMAGLVRTDVLTEEIGDSQDLGALLLATTPDSAERLRAWNATRRLLKKLASVGARHHDLNVKNILLRRDYDGLFVAYVLDVDRVAMDYTRRDAYAGNRARLRRSVEKWRDTRGARISDAELAALRRTMTSTP